MSLMFFSILIACLSPEVCLGGKSICVKSPVIIILLFSPKRVKNILICSFVVFCASSKIT